MQIPRRAGLPAFLFLRFITPCLAFSMSDVLTVFTINCGAPLIEERIDPLLYPNNISPHVHMVAGGDAFNFTVDGDELLHSSCSTCGLHPDKSAYWNPKLYYEQQDGKFVEVPHQNGGSLNAYYNTGAIGPNGAKLTAFPAGFRMYTGNPFLRECQNPTTNDVLAIQIGCYGPGAGAGGKYYYGFPPVECETLRLQINFPNCWDGRLESDDNSHVAFPETGGYQGGTCPGSHPTPLISLFNEVGYTTKGLPFYSPTTGTGKRNQPFVLAQGDASGCGLHGDMISGWEGTALQDAIDYFSANVAQYNTPGFGAKTRPTDGQPDYSGTCSVKPVLNTEVKGPMDALPGCNAVTGIGPNAQPVTGCNQNDNWAELAPGDFPPMPNGATTGGTVKNNVANTTTTVRARHEADQDTIVRRSHFRRRQS